MPRLRSLAWVRESVAYSREQIARIFGLKPEESGDVIISLIRSGILRQLHKEAVGNEEDPLEAFIGKGDFAFCLVGMYCYRGCLVYSLPKYATADSLLEPDICPDTSTLPAGRTSLFSQILQVIARYKTRYERAFSDSLHEKASDCYLALLVTLLSDYAENGEYRDDDVLVSINGSGRTLWNRTIDSSTPFMQNGKPVYVETYTCRPIDAEEHFITRLHRVVVKECFHQLSLFHLHELLQLPSVETIEDSVDALGEPEYLLHCVEGELELQFDSRRRHILQLMQAYLRRRCEEDVFSNAVFVFGCVHFHTVWEDVCRETLGKAVEYKIAPPVWQLACGARAEAGTLRPDMVFQYGATTYVLDAKYYLPVLRQNNLSALPGVNDIVKQFLYEQEFANSHSGGKVFNAFLLPMPTEVETGEPFERYGEVSMALFPGRCIDVFRLHAPQLYAAYLSGSRCDWLELMFSQI